MLVVHEKFKDPEAVAVKLDYSDSIRERLTDHFNLLNQLGDFKPAIFGGALRDAFAGKEPADFDFCLRLEDQFDLNIPTTDLAVKQIEKGEGIISMMATLAYSIDGDDGSVARIIDKCTSFKPNKFDKLLPWFEERGIRLLEDPHEQAYRHISMVSFKGECLGLKCDFVFADTMKNSTPELAMYGDAPVNCIAMDTSGEIWAHPDFEKDLLEERYALRVLGEEARDRAIDRIEKLQARYPDMTLETP